MTSPRREVVAVSAEQNSSKPISPLRTDRTNLVEPVLFPTTSFQYRHVSARDLSKAEILFRPRLIGSSEQKHVPTKGELEGFVGRAARAFREFAWLRSTGRSLVATLHGIRWPKDCWDRAQGLSERATKPLLHSQLRRPGG